MPLVYVQSVDASYVADVYDELLTQAEIQGNINKVNGTYVSEFMLVCHGSEGNVKCSVCVLIGTSHYVGFHVVWMQSRLHQCRELYHLLMC